MNSVNELVEILRRDRFWIYGTGFVANIFWQSLIPYDICRNVKGFIVSKKNRDFFSGLNVRGIDEDLNIGNDRVCIAVHESNKNEVVEKLESKGINNYIFIYSYLWDLKLGIPRKRNMEVKVSELIKSNLSDYKLIVRHLVLEQYFGKNDVGYDLYRKAFENYVDRATAQKRLNRFIEFISLWQSKNYITGENIKVNNNKQIIDGNHRIILANYFCLRTINCDIYDTEETAQDIYGKNAAMTEEAIKLIYDMEERKVLERCREKLLLESGSND